MKKTVYKEAPRHVMPKAYRKFDIIKCKDNNWNWKIHLDGGSSDDIIQKGIYWVVTK